MESSLKSSTTFSFAPLAGGTPAAVLVELCGVLYDDSCWRRWMLQLLARMGLRTQYKPFFQTWEQAHFPRVCSGELSYWDGMREFLQSAGLSHGCVAEACAAGQSRRLQWERTIRPLPGVEATLRQLSERRTPIAVIAHASFDQATAVKKLRQLGLLRFVDHGPLATAEIGRAGHYACRFQAAADCLGLPPERIAYVGCGLLPLLQAAEDGYHCFAFNSSLNKLPARKLRAFGQLAEITAAASTHSGPRQLRRRAG